MKRFLSICLLVAIIIGTSSFTVNPKTNLKGNPFKPYYVVLTQSYLLDNGCTVQIHISLSFNWNGPGTPITNVYVNQPQLTVDCTGVAKTGDITTLDIGDADAHVSALEFSKTGDDNIDEVLSNSHDITILMSGLNSQIDAQKN